MSLDLRQAQLNGCAPTFAASRYTCYYAVQTGPPAPTVLTHRRPLLSRPCITALLCARPEASKVREGLGCDYC